MPDLVKQNFLLIFGSTFSACFDQIFIKKSVMKKITLLLLAIGISLLTFSQSSVQFKIDTREKTAIHDPLIGIEPLNHASVLRAKSEKQMFTPPADRDVNIVTIVDIGTSANPYGYGYAGGQRSLVWADQTMNTVTNFHRMGGALDPGGYSGDYGYDISTDGGINWENMVEVYIATENEGGTYYKDAARYPNHAVYNPSGSDNPDDAYVVFFGPNLWGANDIWGGYSFGVASIGDTSYHTKNIWVADDEYFYGVPDGYDFTTQGMSIVIDDNYDLVNQEYQQNLIVTKGFWNSGLQDFEYDKELLDATVVDDLGFTVDEKVAFGPDGMTGYITVLANNGDAEEQSGFQNLYPIYWKTTDGGENWDGPFFIQLDGADGLGGIVYHHLTDEQIAELFEPPVPAREDISYTTAFDHDIAVDAWNNLHIAVVIGPTGTNPFSIVTAEGYLGAVDIFTKNGGDSWEVEEMGRPRTFRGTFGNLTEDNRIQITTSQAADKIFISWLDTDLEDEADNNRPNIWVRGFHPITYIKTLGSPVEDGPTNVTLFSEGMWQAYMGTVAKYTLEQDDKYILPYTYEDLDPNDDLQPVQFKYITDFSFTAADFTLEGIGDQTETITNASVSQNFPNPFKTETYVNIGLNRSSELVVEVHTLIGQMVSSKDYGLLTSGQHTLTIDGSKLSPGVYFFTVKAGDSKITRKMIVE